MASPGPSPDQLRDDLLELISEGDLGRWSLKPLSLKTLARYRTLAKPDALLIQDVIEAIGRLDEDDRNAFSVLVLDARVEDLGVRKVKNRWEALPGGSNGSVRRWWSRYLAERLARELVDASSDSGLVLNPLGCAIDRFVASIEISADNETNLTRMSYTIRPTRDDLRFFAVIHNADASLVPRYWCEGDPKVVAAGRAPVAAEGGKGPQVYAVYVGTPRPLGRPIEFDLVLDVRPEPGNPTPWLSYASRYDVRHLELHALAPQSIATRYQRVHLSGSEELADVEEIEDVGRTDDSKMSYVVGQIKPLHRYRLHWFSDFDNKTT